ncbi:MAG: hypothetical protein ICV60_05765 [Pyrinomonadaceae bacterium]|nr:hypothetical protein [Pyrinomonadaceae bacterium]
MKLRKQFEGLSIGVIFAALLVKDALVAITANETVNKAGADAIIIGRVAVPAKEVNGRGTVETYFKELVRVKFDGAVAAGDRVKMAAADGGGIQRVKKWTAQTVAVTTAVDADLVNPYVTAVALNGDSPDLICGVCLVGGADGAEGDVLMY